MVEESLKLAGLTMFLYKCMKCMGLIVPFQVQVFSFIFLFVEWLIREKNISLNCFSIVLLLPSSSGRVKESKTDILFSWLIVIVSLGAMGGKKPSLLTTWEAVGG